MPWYGYLGATLGYVLILALLVAWLLPILRAGKQADDMAGRDPAPAGGRVVPLRRPRSVTEHGHTWHLVSHLDGCHMATWAYTCPCGASRHTGYERDIAADPEGWWIWAEETCQRCQELAEGAEPDEWDEIEEAS